jgi:hypothetical protein
MQAPTESDVKGGIRSPSLFAVSYLNRLSRTHMVSLAGINALVAHPAWLFLPRRLPPITSLSKRSL